jgi:hypothetical protein
MHRGELERLSSQRSYLFAFGIGAGDLNFGIGVHLVGAVAPQVLPYAKSPETAGRNFILEGKSDTFRRPTCSPPPAQFQAAKPPVLTRQDVKAHCGRRSLPLSTGLKDSANLHGQQIKTVRNGAAQEKLWKGSCIKEKRGEKVGAVTEIIARTFVIAFVLFYAGLLVALLGWSIWKRLGSSLGKGTLRHLVELFRHLHLPNQPRNAH